MINPRLVQDAAIYYPKNSCQDIVFILRKEYSQITLGSSVECICKYCMVPTKPACNFNHYMLGNMPYAANVAPDQSAHPHSMF